MGHHATKLVSIWLQKEGVEAVGPWPGNSPDLNPIENCRNYMKDRVLKFNPTSADDLKQKNQISMDTGNYSRVLGEIDTLHAKTTESLLGR